jgi:ABC-type siderophore export system fused ATPase/permease subunit
MPPKTPLPLPEEFLAAEFEYIANSAFQANEDRSKAASFFLVAVGSLVAAIFGAQLLTGTPQQLLIAYRSLAGLFFVLTLLGSLTVARLARLRLAWLEAARAMNQMKDFVAEQHQGLNLKRAFRWRSETLPKEFKADSISFYSAMEVTLLSALTFGAFVYFSMMSVNRLDGIWLISIGAGGVAFITFVLLYIRMLKTRKT